MYAHVHHAVPRALECLLTDGAGVRLYSGVCRHVRHQDVGPREPPAALVTAIRPLPGVRPHVRGKVAHRSKLTVTVLTHVLLLRRLAARTLPLAAHMVSQTGQLRVLFVAVETAEHIGLGVLTVDVIIQFRRVQETAAADGASVRLHILTMRSKMGSKKMGPFE